MVTPLNRFGGGAVSDLYAQVNQLRNVKETPPASLDAKQVKEITVGLRETAKKWAAQAEHAKGRGGSEKANEEINDLVALFNAIAQGVESKGLVLPGNTTTTDLINPAVRELIKNNKPGEAHADMVVVKMGGETKVAASLDAKGQPIWVSGGK